MQKKTVKHFVVHSPVILSQNGGQPRTKLQQKQTQLILYPSIKIKAPKNPIRGKLIYKYIQI